MGQTGMSGRVKDCPCWNEVLIKYDQRFCLSLYMWQVGANQIQLLVWLWLPKNFLFLQNEKRIFFKTSVYPWTLEGGVFRCIIVDIFYVFIWQMFSFTKFSNVIVHQVSKCFWPEIQLQILATIWHTQVAFITTLAIFIVIFLKILHHINLKFQSHTFYWKHAWTYLGSHSCQNLHSYSHRDTIHVPYQLF